MTERDPFWRLRPAGPPPTDEVCDCADTPPIVLEDHFSENPLVCLRCNGEVPPERIGFTQDLAETIHAWWGVNHALLVLWLDSAAYEDWARAELINPDGQVNVEGLAIVDALNTFRRTYYYWFSDQSIAMATCPRCDRPLTALERMMACEPCSIVVPVDRQ